MPRNIEIKASVDSLGEFMELEVVLEEHEGIDIGVAEAHALMLLLGIEPDQQVEAIAETADSVAEHVPARQQ